MPACDIGNDIGKGWRKGRLALASCDRNEATTCAQDQREASSSEPNKKGDRVGRLWLARLVHGQYCGRFNEARRLTSNG